MSATRELCSTRGGREQRSDFLGPRCKFEIVYKFVYEYVTPDCTPPKEGGAASPAVTNPIPSPHASLSFLVKQPGGIGCKLHSKCSKCPPHDSMHTDTDRRSPL